MGKRAGRPSPSQDALQLLVPVIAGAATAMLAYKAASSISGIIETLINVTKNQTIAQAALNAVMNANPFVLLATLIAGVVTALTTLYLTNETFRNKVNAAWASVKGTISNSVEAIVKFLQSPFQTPHKKRWIGSWIFQGEWKLSAKIL